MNFLLCRKEKWADDSMVSACFFLKDNMCIFSFQLYEKNM